MALKKTSGYRLVHSTDQGRLCPGCGRPPATCRCPRKDSGSPGDGIVRVRREVQGRKGKTVTTIQGVPASVAKAVAKKLKQRCGAGGSYKDGVIEIQGDHRDIIVAELEAQGYSVRRAGG